MRVPPRSTRLAHNPPTKSAPVEPIELSLASSSKTYQIACTCGRPVIFSEATAGTSHHCVCGHTLAVPRLDELESKQSQGEVKLLTSEETRHLTPSNQSHRQTAVVVLGGLILIVGAGLWLGNRTGFFPTFPFVGYLTMGLGGLIIAAGRAGTFGL
ncbi:MAG TPA: hypothetical protein PLN21_17000 [Gemmatales bacterium]|nr:hypothetical protein [Gemmatales bacterium]